MQCTRIVKVDDDGAETPVSETKREEGSELHQELPIDHADPLFRGLHRVIRGAIRVLAVLMVAVILWGARWLPALGMRMRGIATVVPQPSPWT